MSKKILTTIIPTILLGLTISGCTMYSSNPGKISDIVGTYELITITKKDENDEKYDYKTTIEAEAYFSISEDGYGYYGYKDKETEPFVKQVYSTFVQDDDDESLYKAIEMTDGVSEVKTWNKEVGCMDEPTMGFNVKSKTLSYTILHQEVNALVQHEVEYQYVCYKKVSKTASLDEVNRLLGTTISFEKPFELAAMEGFYTGAFGTCEEQPSEDYDKYEYFILDMDSYEDNQINAYYSLKSNPGKTEIKANITLVDGSGKYKVPVLHALDKEYEGSNYGDHLYTSFVRQVWSEPDESGSKTYLYGDTFSKCYLEATTIDELIAQLTA